MPSTRSHHQQLKLLRHKAIILSTTLLFLLFLLPPPAHADGNTNGLLEPPRNPSKRGFSSWEAGSFENCTCARELAEMRKEVEEERAKRRELRGALETYVSELYDLKAMVRTLNSKEGKSRDVAATKYSSSTDSTATPSISFSAKLSFNQELKPLDTIIFDTVVANNAEAYNAETGKFTAPLPGTYMFFATILSGYNTKVEAALIVNDKEVTRIYAGAHDAHGSGSNAAIISLRSGDSVCVRLLHQGGSHVHGYYSTFSGAMLTHEEQRMEGKVSLQVWDS